MLSLDSFRLATAMFLVFLLLLSTNSKAYSFSWGTTPGILLPQTNFQKSAHIFALTVTKSKTSNNEDAAPQDSSGETNSGDDHDDPTEGITEMVQTSNVRIDDGGSALTDRFKYKVICN